jgi:hypothetical protein
MILEELVFDKNKILAVNRAIEDLCMSCAGLGILCKDCPTDETKKELNTLAFKGNEEHLPGLKEFEVLIGNYDISLSELIFDKNKVMTAQNTLEDLCADCQGAGILCFECTVHQARRTLASMPVIDVAPKFAKKAKKEKSASGGSCGTSCSTGCGTKK